MGGATLLATMVDRAKSRTDFPHAAKRKAAVCLFDFLSCSIEAADLAWSRQSATLAEATPGKCPVVGESITTSAHDAAFANGVRGHGLVREDMHAGSISHMGVVVWPVIAALVSENSDLTANPFQAAIAGYEIGGRIGRALITPGMARRFRPTGIIGPLAGTLAGAILLGFDRETTINALALAANTAGGLNEWPHSGADDMYFHPGFAARSAITALRLAELGAKGSASALDGPAGLFASFQVPLPENIALFADGQFEIEAVFNKEAPACNFAQSPCQTALAAARRIPQGDEVETIHLSTYQAAINYPGCNFRGPFETPLQAKMSIYFGMAATLAQGEIAEKNYSLLGDARISELIAKTTITVSEELDRAFPARQGAIIRVQTKGGHIIEETLDDVRPASPELVRHRLKIAAQQRFGNEQAERLETALDSVSEGDASAEQVAKLIDLCRKEGE